MQVNKSYRSSIRNKKLCAQLKLKKSLQRREYCNLMFFFQSCFLGRRRNIVKSSSFNTERNDVIDASDASDEEILLSIEQQVLNDQSE